MTNKKADLLQGTLDMLILKALSLGTLHGYGVIQRIRLKRESQTGPHFRIFPFGHD